MPTWPRSASWSGTQYTPRLSARAIIAKAEEMVKAVCNPIKAERAPSAADADDHRGFADKLNSYIPARIGQSTEEACVHPVNELWIKTFRILLYNLNTVDL